MKTILLLEQDGTANEPLTTLLCAKGYNVIGAANGTAMLSILENGPPVDIVLACLPVCAEKDLFSAVRQRAPHLPMLYITACPEAGYAQAEQCEAVGSVPRRRPRSRGQGENVLVQDIGRKVRIALHASSGVRHMSGRLHKSAHQR